MSTATTTTIHEFRSHWLPSATTDGLNRLAELLADASPLLIHGSFSRCATQGCLATHLAWHHPQTSQLTSDAGIAWLTRVARLNPATSRVVLDWDRFGVHDWVLREELLAECREELRRRSEGPSEHPLDLCAV
jgi:hypothetical protein